MVPCSDGRHGECMDKCGLLAGRVCGKQWPEGARRTGSASCFQVSGWSCAVTAALAARCSRMLRLERAGIAAVVDELMILATEFDKSGKITVTRLIELSSTT